MPFLGTTGGASVKQYGGQANLGYFIKNSLRTRSSASAYLNRTPATATNQKVWTWSAWVKRGTLGTDQSLFATSSQNFSIFFGSGNDLRIWTNLGNGSIYTSAVYRDTAAWYHIVLQRTSVAPYFNLYVNGVQVTSFAYDNRTTYPGTADSEVNSTVAHYISGFTGYYFDGYMAEINFIDGQALTPSSFGKTDAATGQWIPKKFAGTYGTNGFYLKFADTSAATAAALGKDSSPNGNNWTPNNIDLSSPTTIRSYTTTGSSTWIAPVGVTAVNYLVVAGGGAGGSAGPTMYDSGSGGGGAGGVANGSLVIVPGTSYTLTVGTAGAGTSGRTRGANGSNSVFATITAIGGGGGAPGVAGQDGAAGGSGGGSSVSGAGGAGTPGQGFAGASSTTSSGGGGGGASAAAIASPNNQGGNGGAGFTSSISGSPVTYGGGGGGGAYSGTPGPGGSGGPGGGGAGGINNANGANATGYGSGGGGSGGTYNTTGTLSGGSGSQGIVILSYTSPTSNTYDAMIDSPTLSAVASNYATFNPLDRYTPSGTITVSNGNLKFTKDSTGTHAIIRGTIGVSTGKWYWEALLENVGGGWPSIGITGTGTIIGSDPYVGFFSTSYGYNATDSSGSGTLYNNNSGTTYGAFYGANDIIGVAFDADAGTLIFYKNGVSQGTYTGVPTGVTYLPAFSCYNTGAWSVNFGQRAFIYTPPSGYKSLNTFNLP